MPTRTTLLLLLLLLFISRNKDYMCTLTISPGINRLPPPDHLAYAQSFGATQHRQLEQLASRFTDSERQRAEEAATAAAIQPPQKAEEERQNGQDVQGWNARMSSLQAVQITLERGSATTAVRSTADVRQEEQGEAVGYFQ